MNIRRSYIRTLLLCLVATFVAVVLPATGFAETATTDVNTGGEPGAGCEEALVAPPGFTYNCSAEHGAPMAGQATVVWIGGDNPPFPPFPAEFSGNVEQFGPRDCEIDISPESPQLLSSLLFPEGRGTFDALKAGDLRGACFQLQNNIGGGDCAATDTNLAEVLAANRITEGLDHSGRPEIKVNVLVLPIRCILTRTE